MKPVAVILHPKAWAKANYHDSRFHYIHVSIGGVVPRKKNGVVTHDGYADMVTPEGINALEKVIVKYKPQIFLSWMHVGFTPNISATIRRLNSRTKHIMWFGNHRWVISSTVKRHKSFIDVLLLNSKDERQYKMYYDYGIPKVATLWDGFDPDEVELRDIEPEYDCIFGGNSYERSSESMPSLKFPGGLLRYNLIIEARKRFNVAVMSDRPEGWPFKCLPAAYHPEYTNSLRHAKITLNVNHFPTLYKAYTRRTIRSIFCGRMHLTFYIPGMEDDFINHKHLVWYNDISEAMELIEHYLEHDDEREKIAKAGLEHAKQHFTFYHRMKDFEHLCAECLHI